MSTNSGLNTYLEGNFAPVSKENELEITDIEGNIPSDFEGEYVRNGPNSPFPALERGNYHWFDGCGMLHAVEIRGGKVRYFNKWVRTQRLEDEAKAGKPLYFRLGAFTNLAGTGRFLFNLLCSKMGFMKEYKGGSANTNVMHFSQRNFALVESDLPYNFQLPDLKTISRETFDGKLTGPVTAHPKVDAKTGEFFAYGVDYQRKDFLKYFWLDKNGQVQAEYSVPNPDIVMVHDFSITENYSILPFFPFTFRKERIFSGNVLDFEYDKKTSFAIFPRNARSIDNNFTQPANALASEQLSHLQKNPFVQRFSAEPGYAFHFFGSFEQLDKNNHKIVNLIGCRTRATTSLGLSSAPPKNPADLRSNLYQWKFNMNTGETFEALLDDSVRVEFPRINEELIGYQYKYGYSALFEEHDIPIMYGFQKYEFDHSFDSWNSPSKVVKKTQVVYGEGLKGGEVVFVPKKNPESEDDGYLCTFIHPEKEDRAEFWIFSAKEPEKGALAKIKIPARIPFGFHGTFFSAEKIENQKK